MGLCLSMAIAFFFTQGMKNLFGKPRPDMLARCMPDTSPDAIAANLVGGIQKWSSSGFTAGDAIIDFDPRYVLVSAGICNPRNNREFKDGFRSFPSGHASSKPLRF
jgi:membrane-associated phospholipid phosphatase